MLLLRLLRTKCKLFYRTFIKFILFCRVEYTYLSQGTPLYRSGRAAFPHPAPHMANRMSDLCVSDSFLLEIIFLVMSISVYWTSFFLGYRHMWLPSLQWHYPPSSVSGKGDSFQFLPPLRTEHATFTAFRSRIYNA